METQTRRKERISAAWARSRELLPELSEPYDELSRAAYAPGALDTKTKRLMAVAAAVVRGCRACMLYQTDHALALGAEPAEVLEACAVAVSLGGTMAAGETANVVEYLAEKGLV